MKRLPILIFVLVALAQLSVPAMLAWGRIQTLAHGRVWKFKTEPVDPEDIVRGRYVALRIAAAAISSHDEAYQKFAAGTKVYFVLKEDADAFAKIERISEKPLSGDNVIIGEISYFLDQEEGVIFPFNRFWVTEKDAPAAEKAYRENSQRTKQNAYMTVRVRNGDAALEQLYIDNQPLADYLRAQAAKK
jgi:uncharacterized membrane-anchored protein